jgi:hypothetical protein
MFTVTADTIFNEFAHDKALKRVAIPAYTIVSTKIVPGAVTWSRDLGSVIDL